MSAYEMKIYGIVLAIILTILLGSAIWLSAVLLREAEVIKNACKNVKGAYGYVDIEIGKKLQDNNAIHFYDIMKIVDRISQLFPEVNVSVDKAFERSRVSIAVSQGEVKSTYTLLATIVEAPYQPQQSKVI